MVLKLYGIAVDLDGVFENDVKMYGTQTSGNLTGYWSVFENDVKMYGTQTVELTPSWVTLFENDVKMYGTQTLALEKWRE